MEHKSQALFGMPFKIGIPTTKEIHRQELIQITQRVLKTRLFILPLGAIFLGLIVFFDSANWKIPILGAIVLLLCLIAISDIMRLRRGKTHPPKLMLLDFAITILLQTGLIWITGAIESPLLIIYFPVGLLAGVVMGPTWQRNILVVGISLLLWIMTLTILWGWLPRTIPTFLDLGEGFYRRSIYVFAKAGILNIAVIVATIIGGALHKTMDRMLEQAINAKQGELDVLINRNQELHYLSSAIAHELKNPLTSIQGLVQLLERGGNEERQLTRFEVLQKEINRLRITLDEFLNFSRPIGDLTIKEVNLCCLMEELTTLYEGIAQAKKIQIIKPPLEHGDWCLRCDVRKIKQALINILQNSLEATTVGGKICWILQVNSSHVEFGIQDTGPGFPTDILALSSEMGLSRKPHGNGIGLPISRSIVEQHGGRLTLKNLINGGCQAILSLPRTLIEANGDRTRATIMRELTSSAPDIDDVIINDVMRE